MIVHVSMDVGEDETGSTLLCFPSSWHLASLSFSIPFFYIFIIHYVIWGGGHIFLHVHKTTNTNLIWCCIIHLLLFHCLYCQLWSVKGCASHWLLHFHHYFSLCMPLIATFSSWFLLVCAKHIMPLIATFFITINVCGGKIWTKFWGNKTRVIMWFGHQNYMGAYFQAPHAAPGQWQMEIHFCPSETNVSPMCWGHGTARSDHSCCHFLFWLICGYISIWMYQIYMSNLHGCMFPGSSLPHLDNDQWKCPMFTNEFCISAHHFNKILQGNVSMVWIIIILISNK